MSDEAKIKLQKMVEIKIVTTFWIRQIYSHSSEILNISFTKVYLLFYIFSLISQSTLL